MAEGTRFRDLQDTVTAFKLHQEKTTSSLEQANEDLRKQQEAMQVQANLQDKKLDDLAGKMDKLLEAFSSLQGQKPQTEGRINQEKEYNLEQEEAYQRKQEENQEYLRSWDNLLEIMQEFAQEEERNEKIKKAEETIQEQEQSSFEVKNTEMLSGTQVGIEENIQEQSSFEVEREIYTSYGNTRNNTLNHQPFDEIPQPSHMESSISECIGEEIVSVMSPVSICKLLGHAQTEAFLDYASCMLGSNRSNFNISTANKDNLVGWLSSSDSDSEKKPLGWAENLTLMGKTKLKVVLQIRRSFMFQYSTKNGVNVVVFKHRWRWKIAVKGNGEEKYVEDEGTGRFVQSESY